LEKAKVDLFEAENCAKFKVFGATITLHSLNQQYVLVDISLLLEVITIVKEPCGQ
jgi:hypothetical protein